MTMCYQTAPPGVRIRRGICRFNGYNEKADPLLAQQIIIII